MRTLSSLWTGPCVLSLAVVAALTSLTCSPNRDDLSDPQGMMMLPPVIIPPAACTKGSTRCTQDHGAAEMCDGKQWVRSAGCSIGEGESCVAGRCLTACEQVTAGNVGCSFYPANLWSTAEDGQFGIVASNTSDKLTAVVTLSDASGKIEEQTAMPGGLVIFKLDQNRNKLHQTEQSKKGFHLSSTAPVAVFQFHPIDAAQVFSGSATLLLPEHVMAKNYFVMSYTYNAEILTTPPQGQGFVAVMGLTDGTDVQVKVPVATLGGGGVPAAKAGDTIKRTLNRMEVLEITQANSLEDISGATVKASSNVVVFGGAGGVTVPDTAPGGNHLGVQMFPLNTWGKHYVASKLKQRNKTDQDYFRIVASVDGTNVSLTGGKSLPTIKPLSVGTVFEFATDQDFEITADQPILVTQYLVAWGNLSGRFDPKIFPDKPSDSCPFRDTGDDVKCLGDANITPLVPVEQYRSDYIFYVPQTYEYDFITVTALLGTTFTLDGSPVQDALVPIGGDAGMYGRVILRLLDGNHRITGSGPFGLLGYGYAYATSYSYVGGLNLEKINPVE